MSTSAEPVAFATAFAVFVKGRRRSDRDHEAVHRCLREELRRGGLERASQFSSRRTSVEVSRILDEVL
jgi:hypothetical protein